MAHKRRLTTGILFNLIGISVILFSLIFPFHFFFDAWIHNDETLIVDAYSNIKVDRNFFLGGIIRGQALITSGNSTITLYLEDSDTNIVLEPREIMGRYTFEFQPQETGLYRLVFENTKNSPCSIYVITWQYYYNILFLSLGIIIFLVGIPFIVKS